MSYVRIDDQHESGRLTDLCARLAGEVRMQLGQEFAIFQDRNDIAWGQQWKRRIDDALDATTFLIPIITPGFFKSPACRSEIERFLDREKKLGRSDLILPLYYVTCPLLSDEERRNADNIAKIISARQYADWRELRFEPFTSPSVGKTLAALAGQIVQALEKVHEEKSSAESAVTVQSDAQSGMNVSGGGEAISIEQKRRSASIKKEPPTIIVDPLHRGDYVTLDEAVQAADPGYRILVRPGLYREGIVIEKAVEIIGDGEPGEVVIEAVGRDTILFRANMGRAVNLTLRQMGGGKWYCVDIAQGRLDLEGCDITSQGMACVAVHGGADPRLRRNRIHGGVQAGLFIYDGGLGTFEDNEVYENSLAGVEVRKGGNPTLRRNRIYYGKAGGIFIHGGGFGTFEDNEIFQNEHAGILIASEASPMLRRNRIYGGKEGGVYIYENGLGTLEDNEIFENAFAGIHIRSGGNPVIRRNRIYRGREGGVFVSDGGIGTIEDNEIFENEFAGVQIKSGGNPVVRRNRIYGGKQAGVYVNDSGLGVLADNEIFGNATVGVAAATLGKPTIQRNVISENVHEAIWVYDGGAAIVEDNDLRNNGKGAFDISKESKAGVILKGNKL